MLNNNSVTPGTQPEGFRQLLLDAVSRHNILPLTSSCNLGCLFCSNRHMPPELDVYTFPPLPETELQELIPYLDGQAKIVIGESSTRLCEGEPFTHPSILPLLSTLRERFPQAPLQITTNGTLLTHEKVVALHKLGGSTPKGDSLLELIISFNCSGPAVRRKVLGDGEPQRVIDALKYCRDYHIPFHGSVVAVPHLSGWDDLESTLGLLDAKGARTIRIFLPGTTRFTPAGLLGGESIWEEIAAFLQKVKGKLRCPLLLEPPLKQDLVARVEGVIGGTGAEQAGLQVGDIITAIDGERVCSGVMAFGKIKKAASPLLTVERAAHNTDNLLLTPTMMELNLRLQKAKGASSGIVMAYDLAEEMMDAVTAEIIRDQASRPLLLTSSIAAPLWRGARLSGLIPPQTRISIVNNHFFGGTICCAGLLTVFDLRKHLKSFSAQDEADLYLIPSAPFDKGGRDLRRESYRELLHEFPKMSLAFLPS